MLPFFNKEGCDIYLEAWGSSPKNEKWPLCRSKPVWVSLRKKAIDILWASYLLWLFLHSCDLCKQSPMGTILCLIITISFFKQDDYTVGED